jgi:Flp pilus assembly protein TadB
MEIVEGLLYAIAFVILGVALIYFLIKRIRDRKNENFEQRKN